MRVPQRPPPKLQGTHCTAHHPKVVTHVDPHRATSPEMGAAHVAAQRASYPTKELPPTHAHTPPMNVLLDPPYYDLDLTT
jgi:hypothetical protein